ncbi:MAG: tyrosine-type recombinase/integrase [Endozoicomonadaceae bacterium]|nr:tyrosine-type recombinase/integrase [Endozoicomonadaceae bacterium]
MSVRNVKDGSAKSWLCECYPNGRNEKRVRKRFATKSEALAFELHTLKTVDDKPWLGDKVDNRRLSELINRWHELHGQQLADPDMRLRRLQLICNGLNNPVASKMTLNDFASFRQMRLDGEIEDLQGTKTKVKANTVNHEHAYLHSVFSQLKKLGEWGHPNPIEGLESFKTQDTELAFLYPEEIPLLLEECNNAKYDYLSTIVKVCLSTGARWSEAEGLRGSQIANNRITFTKTKGKKNRTVPISKELANELPRARGQLFRPCRKSFQEAVKRAKIILPEGQMTHVLRHTFASHFMMNGGNILVLKEILGHSDIKDTMRYAHFAPTHLEDAISKNPLANL